MNQKLMKRIRLVKSKVKGWAFRQISDELFTCHDCRKKIKPPVESYLALISFPNSIEDCGLLLCADCLKTYNNIQIIYDDNKTKEILKSIFSGEDDSES